MKRLKRGFFAFLFGEFFALFKKDQQFKQGVMEKGGMDKIQHIFEGLLNFNKELVEDAKEKFDAKALESHLQQGVTWVEHEYAQLLDQIEPLKAKGASVTHEFLTEVQQRFDSFTHTALLIKDQITAFDVQEKIQELKKMIETLAKQAKKQ